MFRIFIALTILTAGVQANDYCAAIAVEDRIGTGCEHDDATTYVRSASSTTNLSPFFPTRKFFTGVKATGAVGITRTTT